jgi:hypothetical protein
LITRREFLKDAVLGLASVMILPRKNWSSFVPISQEERLGRVTVGMAEVKNKT